MKLTTNLTTNRQARRKSKSKSKSKSKRTIKLWRLQDDGRKLFAGTIVSGSPAELVAMWAAFLVTAERGVYFATSGACPSVRKRPSRALLCRWRPDSFENGPEH